MKHYLFTITVSLIVTTITYGQTGYEHITFDDTTFNQHLFIDSTSNINNIWQIGSPHKTTFTSAYSVPNAILTDTINPYPINDTSSFIITHEIFVPGPMWGTSISGYYKVNTDTLNDYGTIEYSMDNGLSWTNVLSGSADIEYSGTFFPTLTGNSNGWQTFNISFTNFSQNNGDTILFRFTFISDSIQTNNDGVMYDNIQIGDISEGIEETSPDLIKSNVYPNPIIDNLNIDFENRNNSVYKLIILDNTGKIIWTISNIEKNSLNINIQELLSGVYYYNLINSLDKKYAIGKFIKK